MKPIWETEAEYFMTSKKTRIEGIRIPQFMTKIKVGFNFSVFKNNGSYDATLGQDFQYILEIDVLNKNETFEWDNVEISTVPSGNWTGEKIEAFHEEYKQIKTEENNPVKILDAKYKQIEVE